MSFAEIQFPTDVSYGSRGGPGFNTNIIVMDTGNEERVSRWAAAKRQYDVRYGIKKQDQMQAVLAFYLQMKGAASGFRYKDWLDYDSTATGHHYIGAVTAITNADQQIGTGDGTTRSFQLVKRYTSTVGTVVRNITKPVVGTLQVAINGVSSPSSNWTLNSTTGILTFGTAPASAAVITAGFEFDVPVRFGEAADKVLMASIQDFGYGDLDPIPLMEISDGLTVYDEAYCGGAVEVCLQSDYQLSASYARGYAFEPQAAGLNVFLPDTTDLPSGGPFFFIMNLGPDTIALKNISGGLLVNLASGQGAVVILTVDGGGAKNWSLI